MKKLPYLLATAVLAVAGLQANAKEENKMVLSTSDGHTVIPIKTITKLTFDGSNMTIATADGASQVNVLSLQSITFDLADLSVENVVRDNDGITVSNTGGIITATADNDSNVCIDVYTLSGIRVATASAIGQASVDLNTLNSGVYVVRINNKVFKFTR